MPDELVCNQKHTEFKYKVEYKIVQGEDYSTEVYKICKPCWDDEPLYQKHIHHEGRGVEMILG